MSHSPELLKPNAGVTDSELQIGLGNLEYDHALTTSDEALANARIFGFTPEEALADANFQINMLQANNDEFEDKNEALKRELKELRSQLEAECADREEIEAELSDLKQKSTAATEFSEQTLPDAAAILSQLRGKRKKSKTELADIEAILEMIEQSRRT